MMKDFGAFPHCLSIVLSRPTNWFYLLQVFKCFCKTITDDGLHRMLRVVKKDLKPARHHNTESEDDDAEDDLFGLEEAEESDEAETGETVDSDQQTDES